MVVVVLQTIPRPEKVVLHQGHERDMGLLLIKVVISSPTRHISIQSQSQCTFQFFSSQIETVRSTVKPPAVDREVQPLHHVGIDPWVGPNHIHQEASDLEESRQGVVVLGYHFQHLLYEALGLLPLPL